MNPKTPEAGWGILSPDEKISSDTQGVLDALAKLPLGQRDAILARAVSRFLSVDMNLGDDPKPDRSEMVRCSTSLTNLFFDFLGRP